MNQVEAKPTGHNVLSLRVLLAAFASLVLLTLLTVVAAGAELGRWEVWTSLGIAALKGSIVAVYFMHLRHDKPLYAVILVVSIILLALFLGFVLLDTAEYQPDVLSQLQHSASTGDDDQRQVVVLVGGAVALTTPLGALSYFSTAFKINTPTPTMQPIPTTR